MPIQTGDIKLLKSQVLLDTTDGGGAMTSNEVIDGQSNNLFPDVSALDRTYGDVAMRKTFPAVQTNTNDSYYGSNVIVSRLPEDPRVNVSLFTTKDWVDRRSAARDTLPSSIRASSATNRFRSSRPRSRISKALLPHYMN